MSSQGGRRWLGELLLGGPWHRAVPGRRGSVRCGAAGAAAMPPAVAAGGLLLAAMAKKLVSSHTKSLCSGET